MRFPVGKGVFIGEDGAAVTTDGEMAFGATLVKGGNHGVEFFMAIGTDNGGLGPIKDTAAIEADGLGIRI